MLRMRFWPITARPIKARSAVGSMCSASEIFESPPYKEPPGAPVEIWSGDQLLHDLAADIGEPKIAALEAVGQARVIEAEQGQQRGVEIIDVNRILHDVPTDLVRLAQDLSAFNS